ncbi:MAG: S26 family signal peptidase [Proteobacteria bacterium]|nr:S26 family signal peptidase [Pseudomonadota bacterium]
MTFRKKIILVIIIGFIVASILHIIGNYYGIAISGQECLPYKLWLVRKNTQPAKGGYVYFNGSNIPLYDGTNVRLIKYVAGALGDTVQATILSIEEYMDVVIEGVLYRLKVKAYVTLVGKDQNVKTFMAYDRRRDGTILPFVYKDGETVTIPEGQFFVIGTHPGSYDSRYWGFINEKNIIGTAYPLY